MNGNYAVGDIVLGNWTLVKQVGEGSYGKVYEAHREDFGVTYRAAIKIITVPSAQAEVSSVRSEGMSDQEVTAYFHNVVEEIVKEFAFMAQLKGTTNIVGYEDHVVIPHEGEVGWDVIIRMEYLTPLLEYAMEKPLGRQDVIKLGIDICKALELCRAKNIVHRDIKPENIMVSPMGDYKLGDFGIARTVEKTTGGLSQKGTLNYMAPEVYKGNTYNATVDIYSLGIVLYRFLNENRTPFLPAPPAPITYSDRERAQAKRLSGEPMPAPTNADPALAYVVSKACAYRPEDRYATPEAMRQDLERLSAVPNPGGNDFRPSDMQVAGNVSQAISDSMPFDGQTVILKNQTVIPSVGHDTVKKKKTYPYVIGGVVALLAIVAGIVVGTSKLSGNEKESGVEDVKQAENSEYENGSDSLPGVNDAFDSMIWGQYYYDDWESTSAVYINHENFMKGMKYEQIKICEQSSDMFDECETLEVSVVPYEIMAAPYGGYTLEVLPVEPGYADETVEEYHKEVIDAGYEQYWDNLRKVFETSFIGVALCDARGNDFWLEGPYKIENGKLYICYDWYVDENDYELKCLNWTEYQFTFKGKNLCIGREGKSVELVPYFFTQLFDWSQIEGYCSTPEDAYRGIAEISWKQDGEGTDGYVDFMDGDYAIDPDVRFNEDGTFQISWQEERDTYNGISEIISNSVSIEGKFIACDEYGCILLIDGRYYRYQATYEQYCAMKLKDVIDEDIDITDISEDDVKQLISMQSSILEDLQQAFDNAGITADIDSNTGKVTLDSGILFAVDDSELSDSGKAYLDAFLDVYSAVILSEQYNDAVANILVEGHTDTSGTYEYNMTLSEARAASVADYCLERQPELGDIIKTKGCSYDNPVYDENGNVDMAASRRVVFKFLMNVR